MIKPNPLKLLFSHQPAFSSSVFAITAVSGCVIIPVCESNPQASTAVLCISYRLLEPQRART